MLGQLTELFQSWERQPW